MNVLKIHPGVALVSSQKETKIIIEIYGICQYCMIAKRQQKIGYCYDGWEENQDETE